MHHLTDIGVLRERLVARAGQLVGLPRRVC